MARDAPHVPAINGTVSSQRDVPVLRIEGLSKSFASVPVLRGVDLTVERGEKIVLMGPSGSGKTTILRCINWLEPYVDGEIYLLGELVGYTTENGLRYVRKEREIARMRRVCAMVFQHFNLFEHFSVLKNVMYAPIKVLGENPDEVRDRAMELLRRVNLGDKADAMPGQLSGGQQQRVAIARALAVRPALLLFDEPTSALDPELVGEVLDVITEVANAGMTMLIVTHELNFARRCADRVVFMDGGVVVESGPPSTVLDAPQHARTRAFIGEVQ